MVKLAPIEINPDTLFSKDYRLPALPMITTRIGEMMADEDLDLETVVEFISIDPALVAQVLRIVNSAFFGLQREVSQVKLAVAYLGLNEIYRIVLSLSVVNVFSDQEKVELRRFWYHSFYTALSTKHLAGTYAPHLSPGELWAAAILHDIGKLVYQRFFPEHYGALQSYKEEQECLFSDAEGYFEVPESSYLGALLCDHWRLPTTVRAACESHTLNALKNVNIEGTSGHFKHMICMGNLVTVLATENLNEDKKREIAETITASLKSDESQFISLMGAIYDLRTDVDQYMNQLL
jgi:HD-like signal output (HDOD) protein